MPYISSMSLTSRSTATCRTRGAPTAAARHRPVIPTQRARTVSSRCYASIPTVQLRTQQRPSWRVLEKDADLEGAAATLKHPQGRPAPDSPAGDTPEIFTKGAFVFTVERLLEFGPVFEWWLGAERVVDVTDYDAIRGVLSQDGKAVVSQQTESFQAMMGQAIKDGLDIPALRLAQRRILSSGFSAQALERYTGVIIDICREHLADWAAAGSIDLSQQGKELSFEFSTRLLVNFRVPEEQTLKIRHLFDDVFRALVAPPIREPGSDFMKGVEAREELFQILSQMIESTPHLAASLSKAKGASPAGAKPKVTESNSVFDTALVQMANQAHVEGHEVQMGVKDAAQAAIGLIIAGNDTSGLGITGLLGLLPMFPGIMERVRQEQQQVIAAHGPELTRAALDAMPYTDAVVKEVLRVLPPAYAVFRRTLVDLEINGYFVPAGSYIHLNILVAQLLSDPGLVASGVLSQEQLNTLQELGTHTSASSLQQQFNPDRWLEPAEKAKADGCPDRQDGNDHTSAGSEQDGAAAAGCPAHAHGGGGSGASWAGVVGYDAKPSGLLTFGSGPHVCLGMGLFNMEAKVLLALLAREYDLSYAQGSANFTYSFFPELRQQTVLNVAKRAA